MRDVGVGREHRLMVLAQKSVETVALVHACLRAGIVFVPVDPDAPAERLCFILNDCAPQATVRIGLIILILSGLSLPYSRPPTAGRGSVTACSKTDQHTIWGDTADAMSPQIEVQRSMAAGSAVLIASRDALASPNSM